MINAGESLNPYGPRYGRQGEYGLSLVSGPTSEPLTVAEVKAHLRLDNTNAEPAPTALTAALAGLGAGNVNSGAHRYLATFVTADGETEAGIVSAAVTTTGGNGQVALSAIPIGGSAVTQRKIYRTAAGGSTYLLLATIADNTTTTYADNIADANLGAGAPSTNTTVDPTLTALITTARMYCENFLFRRLFTQTWDMTLDRFPDVIRVPYPPLVSVTSITYVDSAGNTQTLSASSYGVDVQREPGRIYLAYAQVWPTIRDIQAAVTVRYVAGYASIALIPAPIKHAMKMLIGHWYENREAVGSDRIAEVPLAVKNLLWSQRIIEAA